jgi:DNA-directed RNA polymerase subunit RPC12/RpoP
VSWLGAAGTVSVLCPFCEHGFEWPEEHHDHAIRCPHCSMWVEDTWVRDGDALIRNALLS